MPATMMWIDASAGVAGDMLLGALVDAGVPLATLQDAVEAVIPGSVRLDAAEVTRAGLRATKVDVEVLADDPPHRTWLTIRSVLRDAELPEPVRASALATFGRLAEAEGHVHGVPAEDVHFHEVGALDAIADVVGTCAGVHALGVSTVQVSPVALGSGTIRAHHGTLPVPAPAVLTLSRGWDVLAGGEGELATPTGLALVTSLADRSGPIPAMRVTVTGVGAGTRDVHGRANVVRIAVGTAPAAPTTPVAGPATATGDAAGGRQDAVVLETNVDDLDPRVWPDVLAHLLAAGASDVWLTPILMKKGRPAHTLHVLASPDLVGDLVEHICRHTSTLGVRLAPVVKETLARTWVDVDAAGGTVRVKLGHRDGRLVQVQPEYEEVRHRAAETGRPVREVLAEVQAAARDRGLVPGAGWPGT